MSLKIPFKKLNEHAKAPTKANPTDAGFDVYAVRTVTIPAQGWSKVPLGFSAAIPDGYCLVGKDRSGLALKNGIHVMAGVIDSSYRGEVCAIIANKGQQTFKVEQGMKIAQLLLLPVPSAEFTEVNELDETSRGTGGFGSSGLF